MSGANLLFLRLPCLKTPQISYKTIANYQQILDGIERMFGHYTPTALIIKTILFHLVVGGNDLPSPSPLTDEEIKKYFDNDLVSLLLVMNLGDNDGWTIFEPEVWQHGRMDTIEVFHRVERLIQDK